jgi:bifunctional non-homologous end joining protein LigD
VLAFVIQKHAASRLHYDLRLELDGVMKSWAVPKGPSLDPAVKRLAVEVEDHPIDYNSFEGTIPKGEYGGGTVMIWDRGVYTYGGDVEDGDPVAGLRRGLASGTLEFVMAGARMKGGWVLVRTRAKGRAKQWLLIKRSDRYASTTVGLTEKHMKSVVTKRTMEQIDRARS